MKLNKPHGRQPLLSFFSLGFVLNS